MSPSTLVNTKQPQPLSSISSSSSSSSSSFSSSLSSSRGYLSLFSTDNRYYFHLSVDGRLKVWHLTSGDLFEEYKESNHLTANYTCIDYYHSNINEINDKIRRDDQRNKKKQSHSTLSDSELGYIALGSKNGNITIWNLSNGINTHLVNTNNQSNDNRKNSSSSSSSSSYPVVHLGGILSLSFNSNNLVSSGNDGFINVFNLLPNFTHLYQINVGITISRLYFLSSVSLSNNNYLVYCEGSNLNIGEISNNSLISIKKYSGSLSYIHTIDSTTDGKYIITGSQDRFVNVWETNISNIATSINNIPSSTVNSNGVVKSTNKKEKLPIFTTTLKQNTTFIAFNKFGAIAEYKTLSVFSFSSLPVGSSSPSSLCTLQTLISIPSFSSSLPSAHQQRSIISQLSQEKQSERRKTSSSHNKSRVNKQHSHSMDASTQIDSTLPITPLSGDNLDANVGLLLSFTFVNDNELVLVRGDIDRCVFEVVQLKDSDGQLKSIIELDYIRLPKLINIQGEPKKTSSSKDVTILSSSSAPLSSMNQQLNKNNLSEISNLPPSTKPHSSSISTISLPHNINNIPKNAKLSSSTSSSLPLLERTLAERLAELERLSGTYSGDDRVLSSGSGISISSSSGSNISGATDILNLSSLPKAGSLQTLLTQSLHTDDHSLFEYVLSSSISSPNILQQTIIRLPVLYVIPLLDRLIALLQSKPSRAIILITWIRLLFHHQTSYLLSLPTSTLTPLFSNLFETIDIRLSSYRKMAMLQGKLEIILAQVKSQQITDPTDHHYRNNNKKTNSNLLFKDDGDQIMMVDDRRTKQSSSSLLGIRSDDIDESTSTPKKGKGRGRKRNKNSSDNEKRSAKVKDHDEEGEDGRLKKPKINNQDIDNDNYSNNEDQNDQNQDEDENEEGSDNNRNQNKGREEDQDDYYDDDEDNEEEEEDS